MRVDTNFFGTVPMTDAGVGPAPVDRRFGQDDFIGCYDNLIAWAEALDPLGYDTMWLTEHHFQYEGYEVVPNLILFGLYLSTRTERLRLGQMFNVVPQWHPLRLAEDYALATLLSGDRMQFGVGRGTVPREAESLGAMVAAGDNELSREADRVNREIFEESMEIIKAAWTNERFGFVGKHFVLPPPGIPDRGSTVQDLTLIPKPRSPVDVYQPISSPDTMEYAPANGHIGVFWLNRPDRQKQKWELFAERAAAAGHHWGPGEGRVLVLNTHIGRTREDAFRTARPGHDEFVRFLGQYGWFKGYAGPDEPPLPFDHVPTLEESVERGIMAIGSIDDVVDTLGMYRDLLDLRHLCLFFDFPGIGRDQMVEQFHLFAEEVMPRLGEPMQP